MTQHRGWTIRYEPPVTGRWRATRFGVSLGASTFAAMLRMIDARQRLCEECGQPIDSNQSVHASCLGFRAHINAGGTLD
jgi:hypothetical protein